jgi:hypothetical protein
MKIRIQFYVLTIISLIAASCSKDNPTPAGTGTLTLHFDNVVGSSDLKLTTGSYTNSTSETFNVTTLRYFVSNIVLKKTDGTKYTIPQDSSYFLVDEADADSQDILLKNIPAGDYNEITYSIGVDSLRSVSDISKRKGVLDPTASDMYWAWNPGYIFFKLEGESTAVPDMGMGKMFYYHIGGYGGLNASSKTFNNIKKITLSLGTDKAQVQSNIAPEIHIYVDVLKVFNGATSMSIKAHPMVMFDNYSTTIAGNYASAFQFGHVHNDPK